MQTNNTSETKPAVSNDDLEVGRFKLPFNRYSFRVLEIKFGPSSKNNPMITFQCELVSPEVVRVADGPHKAAGIRATMFSTLTEDAWKHAKALHRKLNLPFPDKFDPSFAPDENSYKGIIFDATAVGQEKAILGESYNEAGELVKEPLLNDDGSPMVSFQVQVRDVLKRRAELE